MKLVLLLLVPCNTSTHKDNIRSKTATNSYRDNYDSVFGKKEERVLN